MIGQWGEVCIGRLLYVRVNRGMDIRPSGSRGAKVRDSDSAPIRVSRFSGTGSPFRVQSFETLPNTRHILGIVIYH